MEREPKYIHEVLRNLRRRIKEFSEGSFSLDYDDEIINLKESIDDFSPDVIVEYLKPLVEILRTIPEGTFQKVSNDLNDVVFMERDAQGKIFHAQTFGSSYGESKRSLMRKEVNKIIAILDLYIEEYSALLSSTSSTSVEIKAPPRVLHYKKNGRDSRNQNLNKLHFALHYSISEISIENFALVFSGKDQEIKIPINWIGKKKNAFRYFLDSLFDHPSIRGTQTDWEVVENCFRFNNKVIDRKFRLNSHDSVAKICNSIDTIVSNL